MAKEQRLIDANKISYHKSGFPQGDGFDSRLDWAFREDIDKLPTVDAVEVVRCKDCVYRKRRVCAMPYAGMWVGVELKDSDFCSYGERRGANGKSTSAE